MSLPPSVRRDVALRLLESVEPDAAFDAASEAWLRTEAASTSDAFKADPSLAIPAGDVVGPVRGQVGRPFMTGRINHSPEAEK